MRRPTELLQSIAEQAETQETLATGFRKMDEHLEGGFLRKELIVIGASTGIGKSYLSSQLCYKIAKAGYSTAIFSLEISGEMIMARLLGQMADVKSGKIRANNMSFEERKKVMEAKAKMISLDSFIAIYDDMNEYVAIEKEIREKKYDFVVIDFIQNCLYNAPTEYQAFTKIAVGFQQLAKTQDCCILLLSQLSNSYQKDQQQSLSDDFLEFKGSGAIAHAADLGFMLKRDFVNGKLLLSLRKNRRGVRENFKFKVSGIGGLIVEDNE